METSELAFDQYDTQVGVVGVLAGPAGVRPGGLAAGPGDASTEPDETVQLAISASSGSTSPASGMDFDLPLDWPPLEPDHPKVLETLMPCAHGETVTYARAGRAQRHRRAGPRDRIDHGRQPAADRHPVPPGGGQPTGLAATPAAIPGASWRLNAGCWRTKEPCRPP